MAVIVILAILIVIATPNVLRIINNSEVDIAEIDAIIYYDSAKLAYTQYGYSYFCNYECDSTKTPHSLDDLENIYHLHF